MGIQENSVCNSCLVSFWRPCSHEGATLLHIGTDRVQSGKQLPHSLLKNVEVMFAVDNKQVAYQVNGVWPTNETSSHREDIDKCRWLIHILRSRGGAVNWKTYDHMVLWRPRGFNSLADAAANYARAWRKLRCIQKHDLRRDDKILVSSDGSFNDGGASVACCIMLYRHGCEPLMLSCIAFHITSTSSLHAEFQGLCLSLYAWFDWVTHHCTNQNNLSDCPLWS